MGLSTDAYLFFGAEIIDTDSGKYPEELQKKMEENEESEEPEYEEDIVNEWIEEKMSEVEGVKLDHHCSCEYPVFYIHTKKYSASRGYSEEIDQNEMIDTEEDKKKIQKVLDSMGIKDAKIGWYLASYMG